MKHRVLSVVLALCLCISSQSVAYAFQEDPSQQEKVFGEEATEIVIAAKNPDAEEIKYEAADFLYHLMVLMVEKGLTWEDITGELSQR